MISLQLWDISLEHKYLLPKSRSHLRRDVGNKLDVMSQLKNVVQIIVNLIVSIWQARVFLPCVFGLFGNDYLGYNRSFSLSGLFFFFFSQKDAITDSWVGGLLNEIWLAELCEQVQAPTSDLCPIFHFSQILSFPI